MNLLLLGSGGREHALAWKLAQSPRLTALHTLPGNPGTALHGANLPGDPTDPQTVLQAARQVQADLVIIGPEAPLAAGVSDALRAAGFRVFGPSQAAARLETSKAFAKAFLQRHGIPTAQAAVFDDLSAALDWLERCDPQKLVLKASGLAAGKGVFLPESRAEAADWLEAVMRGGRFGAAGQQVVIEERLSGPEVSVLAFSDGRTLAVMPPAQDHKRLLDDNRGPNTGGMGAFAPSPLVEFNRGGGGVGEGNAFAYPPFAYPPFAYPPFAYPAYPEITRVILQPAIDGLRAEGTPFVGVLYAGLMLTSDGPRVLEFNARFGDPETQAILPLLESDLLEICLACADGELHTLADRIRWRAGAAVNVVLAAPGYPDAPQKGLPISGLEAPPAGALVFHAGTRATSEGLVTSGGRVLSVTCLGENLAAAREKAYAAVARIHFEGVHYRRDIGRPASAYAAAGVDIAAGNRAVELMKAAVRSTFTPAVRSDVGAFGGLFSAAALQGMDRPLLVASTDGVGTKVALAARAGRYEAIGHDIVNHCVNDILVQGARPLFFLDYIAADKLVPEAVAAVVQGMAAACRENGCALLGGETAEMPGVYAAGHFDVAGTIVGVVDEADMLPRPDIRPGDVLVGLASSGPHTNGYSLIRRVFDGLPLETVFPELGVPLAEALLVPHRSYLPLLAPLLGTEAAPKALAHITGGGFYENLPRVLPAPPPAGLDTASPTRPAEGLLGLRVDVAAWTPPPLFRLIQRRGAVPEAEMYRVFNMGIGMVAIVAPQRVDAFRAAIPEPTFVIGQVTATPGMALHRAGRPLEAAA
ncbi:MAG: hypothetical protein Fur0018_18700 [Anaerolineales bacterium]